MMIFKNEFTSAAIVTSVRARKRLPEKPASLTVNDVHSQLNTTKVLEILRPRSEEKVQNIIRTARKERRAISIAGGRHAMGGQQFGRNTLLIDVREMNRVLDLDRDRGIMEAEAGIEWPELIDTYLKLQAGDDVVWGIAQKQTGADRFTLAGTIAANAHGRGLTMKPFISDVESFILVDATGTARTCSRTENSELFRLVHGGYGLFGIVTSVRLRLVPRQKLERVVEIRTTDDLIVAFEKRIADGFQYGDFQFSIDPASHDFLRRGVFCCYKPVPADTPIPPIQKQLTDENLKRLLYLAHTDPRQAFERYAEYYLSTNGQVYWSDQHQLSVYPNDYHREIDASLFALCAGSEMITEINVPRRALKEFLGEASDDFRRNSVELVYGTVRLIERDDESFLPWAREQYACTVFNLHTIHNAEGIRRSRRAFCRLIDMAARRGGTYYLTYHRYASRKQVEACYPQFAEFLRLKKKYDSEERFQGDWYRHNRAMFADVL